MPNMFGEWGDGLGHLVHLLAAFLLARPIGWNRARAEHGTRVMVPGLSGRQEEGED
ncbi:MAG: hypothetical protein WA184_16360 [Stellaceae bacterium]